VAATLAAIASLNDLPYLQANVDRLVAERDRMWAKLNAIDFLKPYPTQSNFILCRVIDREAKALKQTLEAQGVLVRYFDKPGLQNYIRISVGKPEQTGALIEALRIVDC
jgi:histidinol-phosphate aminotransferase